MTDQNVFPGPRSRRSLREVSFSPKPTNLRIQSPDVPNLTLVDLPGLIKVAVEGRQSTIST
jgi:hypothetical protein